MRSSALLLVAIAACADDHPDTGYGANQSIPPITCYAACTRLADCAVQLCNEDSGSSKYDGIEEALVDQCEIGCDDSALSSQLSASAWSCTFMDSCRQVFEHDACNTDATYHCN